MDLKFQANAVSCNSAVSSTSTLCSLIYILNSNVYNLKYINLLQFHVLIPSAVSCASNFKLMDCQMTRRFMYFKLLQATRASHSSTICNAMYSNLIQSYVLQASAISCTTTCNFKLLQSGHVIQPSEILCLSNFKIMLSHVHVQCFKLSQFNVLQI